MDRDRVGRYQLIEKLGEGGMGVVYKAFDPLIERTVAVKLISGAVDDAAETRERFFAEARAAGRLSHRNIVTIYDLGEEAGHPFFAMEFLEGRDLSARIRSPEVMTLDRKLDIVAQVAEGLSFAHARGITHRDIKPANIFITKTGQVKILDFGLARLPGSQVTRSRSLLGTINYLAPEQVRGEPADQRTDIFALGVVLYEMLAGRTPFESGSFATTLHRILTEVPAPIAALDPCVRPEVSAIVDRALAKAPEERYLDASALLADLAECRRALRSSDCAPHAPVDAAADVVPAPRPPAPGSSSSRLRLPPRVAAPVFLLMAAVVLLAGGWWALRTGEVAADATNAKPGTLASPGGPVANQSPETALAEPVAASVQPPDPERTRALPGAVGAEGRLETVRAEEPARLRSPGPGPVSARPAEDVAGRRSAEDALGELGQTRAAAGAVSAPALVPEAFRRAEQAETEGRASYDRGEYGQAAVRLHEAVGLFRRAEIEARMEQRRRAEDDRLRARELERAVGAREAFVEAKGRAERAGAAKEASAVFREADGRATEARDRFDRADYAGAVERFEAAAAGMDEARRLAERAMADQVAVTRSLPGTTGSAPARGAAGPGPVSAGALQPEEARAAAEAAILDVLGRYRAALEARDLPALERIWPGLQEGEKRALRAEFDNARRVDVELLDPRIAVAAGADAATVQCRRRYRLETRDGQRLQVETITRLTLQRRDGAWLIASVRHENLGQSLGRDDR